MWDANALSLLHSKVSLKLDVVFTHKCAMSENLVDYIKDHASSATSFNAMHEYVESCHHRAFQRARLRYVTDMDYWNIVQKVTRATFRLTLLVAP